ncbi:MAG: hypothetical protein JM58_11800 [Peptococcaceae bacterium BICA1-8]|nr:MAG: hypothetical protein JM58_11800 [Peptococcaceae bacterium BICA1-8]
MPIYDYRCEECGKFQVTQGIKEKALNQCPTCGNPIKRLISKNVNIILKGSGFYSTDNKTSSTNIKSENSGSKTTTDIKSEKSDTKTADIKADTKSEKSDTKAS